MALTPGTRLGPYEITAPLGAGGMGEVYRARDARLGRDVAIKALPAAFAQDPERLARFEREAKLLASLSHPNIAGIHGLEEVGGARYLALEYVEGESLADRLERGPLPLDEALDVARQVAAGVEAAHENDVIHRDLKPGNVMLAPTGAVKVLDFGLARSGASERAGSDPNISASPTMNYAATQAGMILGTAAYMSPEQARGRAVDKRTDVWSFGCLLYECLTGRQAFAGETVSDIVARILQTEPEWSALPKATPERIRLLLGRCLEKDAKRRLRDIGEARIEIEDLLAAPRTASGVFQAPAVARAPAARPARFTWAAVALTAVIVAAATWFLPRLLLRPAPAPAARFEVAAPNGFILPPDGSRLAFSPDGSRLAMIAADSSGNSSIWVRRLDSLVPRRLPGTEGAALAFWSPDGRSLAFFANDQALMKIGVDGTGLERICESKAARGGAWGRDGTILFAPLSNGGIFRVSSRGGTPVQVTRPDSAHGVTGHRFPVWLPDGKHFLFAAIPYGADGKIGLCVGSLDGGATREIARIETGVVWLESGWLVTTRNRSLVAWRFDPRTMKIAAEPAVVGDATEATSYVGCPLVTSSRDGTLAFVTRQDIPMRVSWYDMATGREIGAPPLAPDLYTSINLSPDDRRAAFTLDSDPTRSELVVADLERGVTTRITQAPDDASAGQWSRDGKSIAFVEQQTQTVRLHSLVDGTTRTLLADDPAYKTVQDFTPDGQALVYSRLDPATKWDLWVTPLDGGPAKPCVVSPANETGAQLSVDGRWIKYDSDESGVSEVYVRPFPGPGPRYQVTIGGGGGGFAHDGKRFFYIQFKNPTAIQAADIRAGSEFSLGPGRPLYRLSPEVNQFALASDDRRILHMNPAEKPRPQAATVLQNWTAAIRKP